MTTGLFDLTGHIALVTGGGSGLGAAIARSFSGQGATVILADVRSDRAEQLAEQLRDSGAHAEALALDVTDSAAVQHTVDDIVAHHGRLDILVNSAGMTILEEVTEVADESWRRIMELNLTGAFWVSRAAARHMKPAGYGRIITIASQAAHVSLPAHTAYTASKSGVLGMSISMAAELGPYGVTSNTISPTVVLTELGIQAWDGPHGDAHKAQIPVRRFAEPEEIGAAVVYLASKEAAMVNGADLRIDGGFTIA